MKFMKCIFFMKFQWISLDKKGSPNELNALTFCSNLSVCTIRPTEGSPRIRRRTRKYESNRESSHTPPSRGSLVSFLLPSPPQKLSSSDTWGWCPSENVRSDVHILRITGSMKRVIYPTCESLMSLLVFDVVFVENTGSVDCCYSYRLDLR